MDWDAFDEMEELSDGGGSGGVPGLGDLHSELGSPSEQESHFDLDDDIEDSEVARVLTAAIGESTRRTLASDSGISVAAAMHPLVHERILRRRTTLKLPWEMPFYSAIFGGPAIQPAGISEVGIRESLTTHLQSVPVEAPSRTSKFVSKRLRMIPLIQSDDQLRWRALNKMRALVLADPASFALGRSLLDIVGRLVPEDEIRQTFNEFFRLQVNGNFDETSWSSGSLWRVGGWAQFGKSTFLHRTSHLPVCEFPQNIRCCTNCC